MINIQQKDITFAMGGPIIPETVEAIKQIKKLFPKSPVILSTWKNQDLSGINVDKIIENDDPGQIGSHPNIHFKNHNRMVLSTYKCLKNIKTKYVVRIRTDSTIHNENFLKLYKKIITDNLANPTVFKQPILTIWQNDLFIYPYHIADFFQFGLTKDIYDLWNIPLATQEEADYFKNKKCSSSILKPFHFSVKNFWCKYYGSEQTIFCKYLYKKGVNIDFKHQQDNITFKKLKNATTLMVNNFFLCGANEVGLHSYKHDLSNKKDTLNDWYKLHNMGKTKWFLFLFKLWKIALKRFFTERIGEKKFKLYSRILRIIILSILTLIIYQLLV